MDHIKSFQQGRIANLIKGGCSVNVMDTSRLDAAKASLILDGQAFIEPLDESGIPALNLYFHMEDLAIYNAIEIFHLFDGSRLRLAYARFDKETEKWHVFLDNPGFEYVFTIFYEDNLNIAFRIEDCENPHDFLYSEE